MEIKNFRAAIDLLEPMGFPFYVVTQSVFEKEAVPYGIFTDAQTAMDSVESYYFRDRGADITYRVVPYNIAAYSDLVSIYLDGINCLTSYYLTLTPFRHLVSEASVLEVILDDLRFSSGGDPYEA